MIVFLLSLVAIVWSIFAAVYYLLKFAAVSLFLIVMGIFRK